MLLYCWSNIENFDYFNISNGVKQGGVISTILFSCYIDKLFSQLDHSSLWLHVSASYAGAFGYADNIALVAPYQIQIQIQILFNTNMYILAT